MTFAMGGAPAPGSDRIPVELFQILKDDAVESAALNMPANLEPPPRPAPPGFAPALPGSRRVPSHIGPGGWVFVLRTRAWCIFASLCP